MGFSLEYGKSGYEGEEVKLHWATADQYYIKTSENFSNYTFDLSEAREIKSMDVMTRMTNRIPEGPMRVHFKIVAAEEGEHNNVKAGEERFFFVDWNRPFEILDHPEGELTVFFHHEADPAKPEKAKNWQKHLLVMARDHILDYLASLSGSLDSERSTHPAHGYYAMLKTRTAGSDERVLLDRYLEQYAARNTEDYFIHKDLGTFLRRELEFYVKNEILNVSDLAAQSDDSLLAVSEAQLRRARAFYRVARKIIDDFLAPLEDFQKKLWLKKKFVIQCDWCITLDLVPEALRAKVLSNDAQLAEWKRLGVDGDPKANNLMAIDARMVDTKFFDADFKAELLGSIPNLDECTSGVLVRSENFQALRLMLERYKEQVKCIYLDPPYNTGNDNAFLYKDSYQHSSWLSSLDDRLAASRNLMQTLSGIFVSTDDGEYANLRFLMGKVFGEVNFVADIIWNSRKSVSSDALLSGAINHTTFFAKEKEKLDAFKDKFRLPEDGKGFANPDNDPRGAWKLDPLDAPGIRANSSFGIRNPQTGEVFFPPAGRHWGCLEREIPDLMAKGRILFGKTGKGKPGYKRFLSEAITKGKTTTTLWDDVKTTTEATNMLLDMFGDSLPKTTIDRIKPKPIDLVERPILLFHEFSAVVLDFFAGSGTTGHAVIDLNRQDREKGIDAQRKYILVEMGEHFDTVLKPRLEKAVYSPVWKNGQPQCTDKGISHCFKYLTLESYEDTLNNLSFDQDPADAVSVDGYLMRYMLAAGTRGSPSLLEVEAFAHPFSCTLDVKKPGEEERETRVVDLVETFNWLLGLRVRKMSERMRFSADFERQSDPAFPSDDALKLQVAGKLRKDGEGPFTFQFVEGTIPRNRHEPEGATDRVLVIWREGTGNSEEDNAALNAFLQKEKVDSLKGEYDLIFVNGSNNIPSLRGTDQTWKVQLIEETFLKRMWEEA